MQGVDTNLLVRFLTDDDPKQAALVRQLIENAPPRSPLWIDTIVLLETLWILGSRYNAGRSELLDAVRSLLNAAEFEIDDRNSVQSAVDLATKTTAEFSDVLIAMRNLRAGCSVTLTFDQTAAKRIPAMELLG